MRRFFGTDTFTFTVDSAFAGVTTPVHSYSTFSQALDEVIDARVYGGMHYRSSVEAGARIGRRAAREAARAFGRSRGDEQGDRVDGIAYRQ